VILGVALAIGLWRLGFGLDLGIAFTDERLVWGRYLAIFVPLELESFSRPPGGGALLYPTLVGYLAGAVTWVTHKLGLIENPRIDVFDAFLVARMMAMGFAVATVALVGFFARWIDSVRAGVFAAALMAVVPIHVLQAHYLSTDPVLCFFTTLALALSYLLAREGRPGVAFLAGGCVGLAFAAKYTGVLAGIPVAYAVVEHVVAKRRAPVRTFASLGLVALGGCLLAAVAGCPLCFLRYRDLLQVLGFYSGLTSYANVHFWNVELVPSLGWYGRPLFYQLVAALPFSLGIGTYLASLGGIVWALRRRDAGDRLLVVTVAAYLFFAVLSRSLLPRYLMPIAAGPAGGARAAPAAPASRSHLGRLSSSGRQVNRLSTIGDGGADWLKGRPRRSLPDRRSSARPSPSPGDVELHRARPPVRARGRPADPGRARQMARRSAGLLRHGGPRRGLDPLATRGGEPRRGSHRSRVTRQRLRAGRALDLALLPPGSVHRSRSALRRGLSARRDRLHDLRASGSRRPSQAHGGRPDGGASTRRLPRGEPARARSGQPSQRETQRR
jgi:hypothetical protein